MAAKGETKNRMRSTRSATLALVAMLELLLLCVSLTFSWFERAQDPVLFGQEIKTADALLSTYRVSPGDDTVELTQFFDGGVSKKFSPVLSGDGIQFTSPNGVPLSTSEIYDATLSFQFKVVSDFGDCDFWLDTLSLVVGNSTFAMDENGVHQTPNASANEETPSENVTEPSSEEETAEVITSEADVDPDATEVVETEEPVIEDPEVEETTSGESSSAEADGEELPEESTESECTETEGDIGLDEEKADTRAPGSIADALCIVFYDSYGIPEEIMSFADLTENKKLFSCVGGESTITCSVWLDYNRVQENNVVLPEGAAVEINMLIRSGMSETRTIWLKDETTQLSTMYPQILTDGYRVELVDPASGVIFPATYDEASGTWYAELPVAITSFDVRYRSKSIGRDVLATWESINGEFVHSFALMDEGVFLKSES